MPRVARRAWPGDRLGLDGPHGRRRAPDIDLDALVQQHLAAVAGALAIVALILTVWLVLQARRIGRLSRRLDGLTRGSDGASLEAVLGQHFEQVRAVVRDLDRLDNRTSAVEQDVRSALGRVGFVRYNPFEDTGGNQSFALAILDAGGSGFVVSSLHARGGTRVYAKAVDAGRSETALSAEEAEAVRRAIASAPGGNAGITAGRSNGAATAGRT